MAPVTTHSQTTSSSVFLVSGRTHRQAPPFSSKPWMRACWKSGTCATEAVLQLPNWLVAAREPASLINQGSKPYWESTPIQLLLSTLLVFSFRLSNWDAFMCLCCLCNSVPSTKFKALRLICNSTVYNIYIFKNVNKHWKTSFLQDLCVNIWVISVRTLTLLDSVD